MKTAPQLFKELKPYILEIERYLESLGYVKGTPEYLHAFDVEVKFRYMFGWMGNNT